MYLNPSYELYHMVKKSSMIFSLKSESELVMQYMPIFVCSGTISHIKLKSFLQMYESIF